MSKKSKKEIHPTLFVFDGTIRYFDDGSMLELHSKVTPEEWAAIVEQTLKYKIFLDCLKEQACPSLQEPWDEEDEWYRLQLDIAVSRIRNIDPLLLAKYDQGQIKQSYLSKMKQSAADINKMVEDIRRDQKEAIKAKYGLDDHGNSTVSSL